ncbi:MAG: hypothetical protein Q9184_000027 [Pyrenodesmia sp. 2 TL-2023]
MPSADVSETLEGRPPPSAFPSTSKPICISLAPPKLPLPSTSTSIKIPSKPRVPSSNPRKRPHSSLNDDDDSDADTTHPVHQTVTAFDRSAGGAISANGVDQGKVKVPLVIPGLRNRDWREESRRKRGKNLLPQEVQAQRRQGQGPSEAITAGDTERDEISKVSGLQFVAKGEEEKDADGDVNMNTDESVAAQEVEKPKSADEEALEALMGDGTKKATLVVPAISQAAEDEDWRNGRAGAGNEDDHFRSDVASRPDMASLDDYARVPVEEFGLGMLRGMGWKEGEVVGKRKDQVSKARAVVRRPALLGIGAKEVSGGVGDELGAWGKVAAKGAKGKGKVDKTYNPVVLKNNKTGEMLTEQELAAKKEKQVAEEEWMERRDKNLRIDQERKSERKRIEGDRERDKKREDCGSRSRRRERSRSDNSEYRSSRRERSRSSDRRHGSSRRERSKSRERRHRSKKSNYGDEDDHRREKDRNARTEYDRDASKSSRHSHRPRGEHDDIRRRRHEVY